MQNARATNQQPPPPDLPPVDPAELERNVGRLLNTKRPPEGWPGKPPTEPKPKK